VNRLHLSWVESDAGFHFSAPRVRVYAHADKDNLDWYCYTANLTFDFPDGVASMSIEFDEHGMRELGNRLIEAADAIARHQLANPEPATQ
jgi:hypothetical protein